MKFKGLLSLLIVLLFAWQTEAQTIPNYVPLAGLKCLWMFNGNANDITGNGYNGVVYGAQLTTDRFGNPNSAYNFTLGNYINLPQSIASGLDNMGLVSINIWFKTTAVSGSNLIYKGNYADAYGEQFSIHLNAGVSNNGYNHFGVKYNSNCVAMTSPWTECVSYLYLNDNNWHMLTGVVSATNMYYYIDGVLSVTTPAPNSTYSVCSSEMNVGKAWSYDPSYFVGQIDDVGIWNRPLTACEIKNLYYASLHTTTIAGPVNTNLCTGDSAMLSTPSYPGFTYQWFANASPIAGATMNTYLATQAGSYMVVSNFNGCLDTSSIVTLNAASSTPINISSSQPTTVCTGNTVLCSCTIPPNCSIVWQNNGVNSGVNTSTYSVSQTATIKAICTNSNGCKTTSNSIAVTVNPLPSVLCTNNGPSTICIGDSVQLTALYNATYTYQWYKNGVLMPGKTAPSLYVNATGSYTYVAQLNGCTQTSNAVVVNVSNTPEAVITSQGNTIICNGQGVLLQTNAVSGYSYQWTMNGFDIPGATNPTYLATIGSYYTVKISNGSCFATSMPITITVNTTPSAIIHWNGVQLFSPIAFATYQWYLNGVLIPGATGQYYTPTQTGVYYVLVSNENGCQSISPNYNLLTLSVATIQANSLAIAPNPTTGFVHIENFRGGSIQVYNSLGQLIINQTTADIDLSQHAKGIYYIRAYNSAQELIGMSKVIKE